MRVFRVDYPEIVDQLIELFVESTPPLLDELRDGAERGDGEAVRRAAHKLKGSCQNIGAGFMATLAHDIEQGERRRAGELAGLDAVFADTRDALRAALTSDAGDARCSPSLVAVAVARVAAARRAAAGARAPRVGERRMRALAAAVARRSRRAASTATCGSCCSRASRSSARLAPRRAHRPPLAEALPPSAPAELDALRRRGARGRARPLEWAGVRSDADLPRSTSLPFGEARRDHARRC